MQLVLKRFAYTPTETQGRVVLPSGFVLWTVEPPWVEHDRPGGKPFTSCVPDGKYDFLPFTRPDGTEVFAMVNPALGVYLLEDDRKDDEDRYLCLWHRANFARQVVGCAAPGLSRVYHENQVMVTSSRKAMDRLRDEVQFVKGHTLLIVPDLGTGKGNGRGTKKDANS